MKKNELLLLIHTKKGFKIVNHSQTSNEVNNTCIILCESRRKLNAQYIVFAVQSRF